MQFCAPAAQGSSTSEQLPCRSAEVNIFSAFSLPKVSRNWRAILVKFSVLRFPLGVRGIISPKFHVENGVKNGKFHASFTLLGRSAEQYTQPGNEFRNNNYEL